MAQAQSTSTKTRASRAKPAVIGAAMSAQPKMETLPEHDLPEEAKAGDAAANEVAKNDAMSQFVNQQTGIATPPAAMANFKQELAALQEKFGVTAEVKVKPLKADKLQRNGITRPGAETKCGSIWAVADEISATNHTIATIAAIRLDKRMEGIPEATIKTQYARWRQYNGVKGRLPTLPAMHQQQGQYEALENLPAFKAPEPKAAE